MECLEEKERACRYYGVCNQISVWHEAQKLLANYLSSVSLQQIADKSGLRDELAQWGQRDHKDSARSISVFIERTTVL